MNRILQHLIEIGFRCYWSLSPLLRSGCRYWPTCSHYAHEAIHTHGFRRGGALAVRRLLRCHPLGGNGFDPVPARIG